MIPGILEMYNGGWGRARIAQRISCISGAAGSEPDEDPVAQLVAVMPRRRSLNNRGLSGGANAGCNCDLPSGHRSDHLFRYALFQHRVRRTREQIEADGGCSADDAYDFVRPNSGLDQLKDALIIEWCFCGRLLSGETQAEDQSQGDASDRRRFRHDINHRLTRADSLTSRRNIQFQYPSRRVDRAVDRGPNDRSPNEGSIGIPNELRFPACSMGIPTELKRNTHSEGYTA